MVEHEWKPLIVIRPPPRLQYSGAHCHGGDDAGSSRACLATSARVADRDRNAGGRSCLWRAGVIHHTEGIVHGFLALRTLEGVALADGGSIQTARGERVTARLVFRFKDGSIHDETAVFSQQRVFRLISDHLVQKGPTFPRPLDMTIDAVKGDVVVRYTDDDGQQKTESEHLDVPPDLANGMILTLLKNVRADAAPKSLPFVAATPKPRLVELNCRPAGVSGFRRAPWLVQPRTTP